MTIQQLSVFLENKSGRLLEVTKVLAENNINLSAFSIADSSDFGILRMIVDQPEVAFVALKNHNFSVSITPVVGLIVPDKPGSLCQALEILKNDAIEVEYMYAFSFKENATVIIRSADADKTAKVLKAADFKLISAK